MGWGAAALLYAGTYALLPEAIAWRVLFFVGVLPGLFVIYVRRHVPESAVFEQASHRTPFAAIFGPSALRATLLGALLSAGVQGGYYAVMTWLPAYLRTTRGLSVIGSSGYLAVVIVAAWLGYVTGAYVSDALGRRRRSCCSRSVDRQRIAGLARPWPSYT